MKKYFLITMITAGILLASCGKETVNPKVEQTQSMEQSGETEDKEDGSVSSESLTAKADKSQSGDPGSPKSGLLESKTGQEEPEQSGEAAGESKASSKPEESAKSSAKPETTAKPKTTAKPEETTKPAVTPKTTTTATTKPETTPKPTATPAAAPKQEENKAPATPAPHTSCTWDGGTVTTAATCSSEGVKTYTCTVCGNTRTESIAASGHSYTTESKAATCTEDGYTKTYCTACGNVQSESTQPATGHTLQEYWFIEPDCTYEGSGHANICINCEYVENLPSAALGHVKDGGHVTFEPDCQNTGEMRYNCTRCGCVLPEETTVIPVDPNKHDWWVDSETGEEYCTACGATR